MLEDTLTDIGLKELSLTNIQAPFLMKYIPASVEVLSLEARGSPLVPIFDEDDYGCEVSENEIRKVSSLTISTSHYKLIAYFLKHVQPRDRLTIEVACIDMWAVEKYLHKLKISAYRLDVITEKLNNDGFNCFKRICNFHEKYIQDRMLTEGFVDQPDTKVLKQYLRYCKDNRGLRYTIYTRSLN